MKSTGPIEPVSLAGPAMQEVESGMNHQVVAAVSKRIADYFIVVDAGPSLSRYPDSEAPLNSHENPLGIVTCFSQSNLFTHTLTR